MFFSEKLVEIAKKYQYMPNTVIATHIIDACYDKIDEIKKSDLNDDMIAALRCVIASYNEAYNILNKQGVGILKKDGLKNFLMQDKMFADYVNRRGIKL